jgi:hypothetical protein
VAAAGWRELRAAAAPGEQGGVVGPTLAADLRRRAGAAPAPAPETVLLAAGLQALAVADDARPPAHAVAVDAQGAMAALVLVPAATGFALGSLDLTAAGTRTATDLTRATATVDPAARVQPVLGQQPLAADDLAAWTALGLAVTVADLVGSMRGAVDLATGYAKDRQQYGTAIGSFQAVQHLLADALVALEGSRSVALHASWAVDALAPADALAAAALAKAYAARGARTVCETAIQVHGGIGNTWECLAHVHLRRALLSTDLLGGAGPCLRRVLAHAGIAADGGGDRGLR